jgi:hypothetical protein
LLNELTTNLESILSAKWRENPETFDPRQILEDICKIEQDKQNRLCMYNSPCEFDPNQMIDSMMRGLDLAQRMSI